MSEDQTVPSEQAFRKIVNNGYKDFKIFEESKAALAFYDQMRQAVEDMGRTVEGLRGEEEAIKQRLVAAQEEIQDAQNAFDVKSKADSEQAQNDIAAAKQEAEKIVSNAKIKAETAINNAVASIEKMQNQAVLRLAEMNDAIAKSDAAYQESVKLQSDLAQKRKELDEEQKRLNKIKSDLAAIMNVKG